MHTSRMRTARSSIRLLGGSASVHAGIPPLGVGLRQLLGVGLEAPWVWTWRPARHAGRPPWRSARHAGIPPPVNRILDTRF